MTPLVGSELERVDIGVGRTRHTILRRPIPADSEAITEIESSWQVAPSWRFGGATPNPLFAVERLCADGDLTRLVCPPGSMSESLPVEGIVSLYNLDAVHRRCFIAVAGAGHPMVLEAAMALAVDLFERTEIRLLLIEFGPGVLRRVASMLGSLLEEFVRLPDGFQSGRGWEPRILAGVTRATYTEVWRGNVAGLEPC